MDRQPHGQEALTSVVAEDIVVAVVVVPFVGRIEEAFVACLVEGVARSSFAADQVVVAVVVASCGTGSFADCLGTEKMNFFAADFPWVMALRP